LGDWPALYFSKMRLKISASVSSMLLSLRAIGPSASCLSSNTYGTGSGPAQLGSRSVPSWDSVWRRRWLTRSCTDNKSQLQICAGNLNAHDINLIFASFDI